MDTGIACLAGVDALASVRQYLLAGRGFATPGTARAVCDQIQRVVECGVPSTELAEEACLKTIVFKAELYRAVQSILGNAKHAAFVARCTANNLPDLKTALEAYVDLLVEYARVEFGSDSEYLLASEERRDTETIYTELSQAIVALKARLEASEVDGNCGRQKWQPLLENLYPGPVGSVDNVHSLIVDASLALAAVKNATKKGGVQKR